MSPEYVLTISSFVVVEKESRGVKRRMLPVFTTSRGRGVVMLELSPAWACGAISDLV